MLNLSRIANKITMETPQQEPSQNNGERSSLTFNVIGAGVIGLLSAIELAKDGHDVTINAPRISPDKVPDITSSNAVGQFLPWVPPEHAESLLADSNLGEVVELSREFYDDLSKNPELTGVMKLSNFELLGEEEWPDGLQDAMGATGEDLEQPILLHALDGTETSYFSLLEFPTFSINTRKTVQFLTQYANELGVKFNETEISPENIADLDGVIINAAGPGAKYLDSSANQDKIRVNNFKGHCFVIRPGENIPIPKAAISVDDLIIMPREDGTVVVGALYIENPDRPIPEGKEADELMARLSELARETEGIVPGLDKNLFDPNLSQILVHQAGYRVEVEGSGFRVAPDKKIDNLLHAYGFGGVGWSVGPHVAKMIAQQAIDMHRPSV